MNTKKQLVPPISDLTLGPLKSLLGGEGGGAEIVWPLRPLESSFPSKTARF